MREFTEEDLKNLEKLCRFRCTEEEKESLLQNLKKIFKYMNMIEEIEIEGAIGKHNLMECASNRMYEDKEEAPLPREELLKNAPSQVGGMVKIPPVIEF